MKQFLSLEEDFIELKKKSDIEKSINQEKSDKKLFENDKIDFSFSFGNLLQEFIISSKEILELRTKTTGIVKSSISLQKNNLDFILSIYDVGSQRNERRKWINCKLKKVTKHKH